MNLRNVDGGDALFKIAAEITGEASLKRSGSNAPGSIAERTNALVGTLVSAIDARIAARFEPELQRCCAVVAGSQTVRADVAPVVREIRGDVGDRFERVPEWNHGKIFDVFDVRPDGARWLKCADGHSWRAMMSELRDPSLFRFISSAADRAAANPALIAAVLGPEMAVAGTDEEDGPPMGPEADVRVGNLRTAAETLIETDTAIADLIRAWHSFRTEHTPVTMEFFQDTVDALASKAGLSVPWLPR